jgi:ABC-type dipeptide/oligopeptide/nickel transport system ATPase component
VLAAAMRPPFEVVAGTVKYDFKGHPIDVASASEKQIEAVRWKHLSYIMQGSMSVLNRCAGSARHSRILRRGRWVCRAMRSSSG